MKTVMKTSMLSLLLATSFAFAADLPTAKKQGLIGEQNNGYLGLVNNQAPADVKALVNETNNRRKAQFAQIAAKNGVTEAEAAKVFAREAAERTLPGNYIQNASGAWRKK